MTQYEVQVAVSPQKVEQQSIYQEACGLIQSPTDVYISINTGLYASDTKTFLGDYNTEKDASGHL